MEKTEIHYSIKNLILNSLGNLVFVAFGVYLLSLYEIDDIKDFKFSDYLVPIIACLFIFSFGKKFIIEIFNFNKKIIFSNKGIELNNRFFEWELIKKEKVISKKEYTPKYRIEYKEFYLFFLYKAETIELKIDDYKTSEEELNSILKKNREYSGSQTVRRNETIWDSIIGYEEYLNLEFEESEKVQKKTEKISRNNIEELKRFCVENLFSETDKISFIYYSLSECENYSFWNDFLTKEFVRVFEIAITQNKMDQLYQLLENITVDDIDSTDAEKVREMLVKELDNQKLEIRLNSLALLDYWLDFDGLGIKLFVISKLRDKTKDTNWKIRWNAHKILTDRKIQVKNLSLMDKIRGRFGSIYPL